MRGFPVNAASQGGRDRLLLAGPLAAVAALPLFFNVYTLRSFEADKTVLLCFLALASLAAWLMKAADRPLPPYPTGSTGTLRAVLAVPLVVPAFLFLAAHALATIWSIHSPTSLFGSYHRLQGLGAAAACFALFLTLAVGVSTRAQIADMVTAMLLASLAVGLYGIFQHLGVDPIVWQQVGRSPSNSTLGNLGFAAGFLSMTVPLALYRLLAALRAVRPGYGVQGRLQMPILVAASLSLLTLGFTTGLGNALLACALSLGVWWYAARVRHQPPAHFLQVSVYLTILTVQVTAIVLTQSRAGFLGLVAGLWMFAWLCSVAGGRRRTSLALVAGTALLAAGIALAALGNRSSDTAHDPQRLSPAAGKSVPRILAIPEDSGTVRVRLLIWQSVADLLHSNRTRALVGYGPDTLRLALYPHYDPALGRLERDGAVADRAHNEMFDVLASVGIIGVVIYLALWIQLLLIGHRLTGAVRACESRRFVWFCIVGVLAPVAALVWTGAGARFVGVLLPVGLVAGAILHVLVHCYFRPAGPGNRSVPIAAEYDALLATALLAVVTAYLVSTNIDVASVSPKAFFWVCAGLLAAMTGIADRDSRASMEGSSARSSPARPPDLPQVTSPGAVPVVAALVVLTLMHDFGLATGQFVSDVRILWLPLLILAAAGVLADTNPATRLAHSPGAGMRWRRGALAPAAWTVAALALYLLIHAAMAASGTYHPAPMAYVGSLGAMLLLWSATPLIRDLRPPPPRTAFVALAALLIIAVGAFGSLTVIEADIRARDGYRAEREQRFADAARYFAAASALMPHEGYYTALRGGALMAKAQRASDPVQRELLLVSAESSLVQAIEQNPRDPDHAANLARLHLAVALNAGSPDGQRDERLRRAAGQYQQALALDPNNPGLWTESASAFALMGLAEAAIRKYRKALQLDATHCEAASLLSELDRSHAGTVLAGLSASCRQASPDARTNFGASP